MASSTLAARAVELNKMGVALVESNELEKAVKYFDLAIEADPNHLESYYNKAEIMAASAKYDEAISYYNRILRIDCRQGLACYQKANILFHIKENIIEAIELYNKSIVLGEKSEGLYFNLCICLESCGRPDDAVRWLDRAIELNRSNIEYHLKKAQILLRSGRIDDAERCYDKVLTLQADNEEAYHYKIMILGDKQQYQEASALMQLAEELLGARVILCYDKAILLEKQGEINEALECIEQGLILDSANTLLLSKRGTLLVMQERLDEAKAEFDKITELDPANMEGLFNKANLYLIEKNFIKAEQLFKEILDRAEKEDPYKVSAYYFRALALKSGGRVQEAKTAYFEALKVYSVLTLHYTQDTQLYLLKANTYLDMEEFEESERLFSYIIDLDSNMAEAYLLRAKNRIYLKKYEEAKEDLQHVVKANPAYERIVHLDELLRAYL